MPNTIQEGDKGTDSGKKSTVSEGMYSAKGSVFGPQSFAAQRKNSNNSNGSLTEKDLAKNKGGMDTDKQN